MKTIILYIVVWALFAIQFFKINEDNQELKKQLLETEITLIKTKLHCKQE